MSRCVVVTGANRGLGLELARQLVERDERVIATAREPESALGLESLGCRILQLDVSDAASVRAFAASLAGEAVDVLVNNAGKGGGRSSFEETDWSDVAAFFEANSIGAMRVTQALLPNLRLGRGRLVVSLTSRMGSIDDNTSGGAYGYRASKAALNMLNKSLAIDLAGEGFTCVVMHPGWVRTNMGGPTAPLEAKQSVTGMLKVLDGLKASDTGRFYNYDGTIIPW